MFIPNPHPSLAGVALDGVTPKVDVLAFITGGYVIDDRHLLVGPNVITALLPEAATQPNITPRSAINHANAGSVGSRWQQLRAFLARASETEPHLQFDGPWGGGVDGQIAQLMPFNVRADCNYKANRWKFGGQWYGAISHETADDGAATLDTTPWTLAMFAALVGAHTAECAAYRIRCTVATGPYDSGIGYHSQYPEWSIYKGKSCPGRARIRQMDQLRQAVATNLANYYSIVGGGCS